MDHEEHHDDDAEQEQRDLQQLARDIGPHRLRAPLPRLRAAVSMAERSQGRQHLRREALDHLEELVEASCEELQLDVAQPGVIPLPQVCDDVVRRSDRGLLEAALEGTPALLGRWAHYLDRLLARVIEADETRGAGVDRWPGA